MESGSNPVLRRFRLMEELDYSEKSKDDPTVSYGLVASEDRTLTDWNASIFGPNGTTFEGRFFEIIVSCGNNYPAKPPNVIFKTKVNLPFVDQHSGSVVHSKFFLTKNWNSETRIKDILGGIKQEMINNKRLKQPNEGETY